MTLQEQLVLRSLGSFLSGLCLTVGVMVGLIVGKELLTLVKENRGSVYPAPTIEKGMELPAIAPRILAASSKWK